MTQEEKIQALRDLGYDVEVIDGKPTVRGWLDLRDSKITSLPDNLVVRGLVYLRNADIESLPDNLVVSDWLDLRGTKITSLPNNLVVGGCLYLCNTKITSLPDDIVVGGNLYLSDTDITTLPDNFILGGSLYLGGTKITSLPDNLVIGGSLVLSNTKIISLPDNLVIGGSLDLRFSKIKSLPNNLVVGGDYIFKNDGSVISSNRNVKVDFVQKIWNDKPYCKVDSIFTEVVNRRGKVWTVRKIGHTDTFYVVNDGNGNYAHGDTIKEAKKDLIYKITNKDKSEYEGLTLESILSHKEAIKCYRTITGACSFGAKNFVENILPQDERKGQYTIAEIIRLTKRQYGNERFTEFFKNKK